MFTRIFAATGVVLLALLVGIAFASAQEYRYDGSMHYRTPSGTFEYGRTGSSSHIKRSRREGFWDRQQVRGTRSRSR